MEFVDPLKALTDEQTETIWSHVGEAASVAEYKEGKIWPWRTSSQSVSATILGQGDPRQSANTPPVGRPKLRCVYVQRTWDAEMRAESPGDPGGMVTEYYSEVLETYDLREAE